MNIDFNLSEFKIQPASQISFVHKDLNESWGVWESTENNDWT
jgi:hypothetical protein